MSDVPAEKVKPDLCKGCPSEKEHCVTAGTWLPEARLTFIGESPDWVSVGKNQPFCGKNGLLLRKMLKNIEKGLAAELPNGLKFSAAYAGGAMGKPSQEVVVKCAELWKGQWATHYTQQSGVHVLVPFGLPAAKSVGLTAKKIMDIRGRTQQRLIGGRQVLVLPTLSLASLYAKPGLAAVVQQDLIRAVKLAYLDVYTPPKTIEELSVDYVFPKTLDEVKAVCDHIIGYFDPAKQNGPWDWPITVDIETNTLKAFRKDAKILMVSFAWDDGKAAAILLNHADNTWYDPNEAWKEVERVLASPKPKAFHNCKFDLQFLERVRGVRVHNVVWDTLCGQHWISEDQKGVYGLKALAPTYAPHYEGYEERLHDALRHGEEIAPTEDDILQEARELSAASGSGSGDDSWFEESAAEEAKDAEEAEELPPSNDQWLADPEWAEGTTDEQKTEYLTYRNEWFSLDAAGKGKERGAMLRKWKKAARQLKLPPPTPYTLAELAKASKKQGFENVAVDTLLPYAAADADVTRIILKKQYRKLHSMGSGKEAHSVMDNLYLPASRALGGLEFRGAKVDLDTAREYESQINVLLDTVQTSIYNLACRHFKINASRQLAEVLVGMGFRSIKETKGNVMSTSKDVIISYQKDAVKELDAATTDEAKAVANRKLDFLESLLLFRAAHKMKSSFLKRLREYAALDGHIHTTFHLTGTSTGRLSSSKLNLQNLPAYMCRITRPNFIDLDNPKVIHSGFNVKALLIPEDDTEVFWNLDIKAAEIRVAAYYSNDAGLIKALNDDLDVHTYFLTKIKHSNASQEELDAKYKEYYRLYKAEDPDITQFRGAVKRVVFGTLYGAGARKIAAQIGDNFSVDKAQEIINALFTAFPGIKAYVVATKSEVKMKSAVSTVFGRYRRFLMAGVSNELSSKSEREAVNFKVQSTSSDLVVSQLCEIDAHLHEIDAVMRLTVHDSMAGTIKKSRVKDMKAFFDYWLVQRVKERFPWMPVPFSYDLEVGPSYGEKKKWSRWVEEHAAAESSAA